MGPVNTMSAACAWSSQPTGDGACSAQPTHLPGLISQAQPGLPPLNGTVFPSFFTFMGKPKSHFSNHQNSTDISCLPGTTDLLCNAQGFYFIFGIFSTDIAGDEGMGV